MQGGGGGFPSHEGVVEQPNHYFQELKMSSTWATYSLQCVTRGWLTFRLPPILAQHHFCQDEGASFRQLATKHSSTVLVSYIYSSWVNFFIPSH